MLLRLGWVTASLGLTSLLVGCGDLGNDVSADNAVSEGHALSMTNGLSAVNGLSATNGLSMVNGLSGTNGLSMVNGLSATNGLSSTNGLMTTDWGRRTVAYIVKCALNAGDSLTKADNNNTNYTFAGGLGLCPQWKYNNVANDQTCQELVSACLMAHLNTSGVHVPIWLDSSAPSIGWGMDKTHYPYQEGTFFGNIMVTGPLASHGNAAVAPVGYYCDGDGFTSGSNGVVAGRIGANSTTVYRNPWYSGALCKNVCTGQFSQGSTQGDPDGYINCSPPGIPSFNNMITVWRNNSYTPVFDSGYVYEIQPYNASGGETLDVVNGSTNNGTIIQQWGTYGGYSQRFRILSAGSGNWKIAMDANQGKCADLSGGGTGNGTQLVLNDCNGSSSQAWNITADVQTGAFVFKNVATGRCLDENGWNTSSGVPMQIWDCGGGTNQKYLVQAVQ